MGRYAYFNTNFEYKFLFGVQPSEDIRGFGGVIQYETVKWSEQDKEYILDRLKDILSWLCIELVDFTKYEKNVDGTHTMVCDLYKFYGEDLPTEVVAKYILGCVIYHQLLYTETLDVHYEN